MLANHFFLGARTPTPTESVGQMQLVTLGWPHTDTGQRQAGGKSQAEKTAKPYNTDS